MRCRWSKATQAVLVSAVAGLPVVPSAFAGNDVSAWAREFSIVCPSAIFEPAKLEGLLKEREFSESDRDGDADSEVVSYKQAKTNLSFEFFGSPATAPSKAIFSCKLFVGRPTPIRQLDAAFEGLMRDPRLSGMTKRPDKSDSRGAQVMASRDTKGGCLSLMFVSFNTSNQKTTELLMERTSDACKASVR
ncbi:hypothetical protein UP09_18040 [Bradyrhizobium sp. LTSP885]|nr:hypothetical protein UP09_18040 [Bradyrhizobium sp. LTSP885]